ncbi:MAG TPA: hypothetical protein VIM30_14860 [Candidatus Limnocylindrales bacterium]
MTSLVAGTSTTYTFTVLNASLGGGVASAGAVLSDHNIPAGTVGSTSDAACSIKTNVTPNVFSCTTPQLAAGASTTFHLTLWVEPNFLTDPATTGPTLGTLTNSATVTANFDENTTNNAWSDTDTITTAADVQIVKTDAPDPVVAGTSATNPPLTYTLAVTDLGPSDATGVVVTDDVSALLGAFGGGYITKPRACVVITGAHGTACTVETDFNYAPVSGIFTISLGTIDGPDVRGHLTTKTILIRIDISPSWPGDPLGSTISNTASVVATTTCEDLCLTTGSYNAMANNTDSEDTTVIVQADLSVTKTDGVASVLAGDGVTHTYTITVHNAGPSDAQFVSLADTWPTGFSQGTITGTGCTLDGGTGPNFTCALGTLAATTPDSLPVRPQ